MKKIYGLVVHNLQLKQSWIQEASLEEEEILERAKSLNKVTSEFFFHDCEEVNPIAPKESKPKEAKK